MKKLKLQVQMSIDGFVAGPNGELDWMLWNWDDALKQYVVDLHEPVDCILMGRKMAPGFIPYWQQVASNPEDPQYEFGRLMTDTPKVVFTKTLSQSEWDNTELATGELSEEIQALKAQSGGDIIVYGGATFVSSLIQAGLIDELHLFINPVAIGEGLRIFGTIGGKRDYELLRSQSFECGIVVQVYGVKREA